MSEDPGLFWSPVPIRFCGIELGGYGDSSLSKHEAALELIVPSEWALGYSLNDLNGEDYRRKIAALLTQEWDQ